MKKLSLIFGALLCLIIAVSCDITADKTSTEKDTLLENAKEYFEGSVQQMPATAKSILPGKISTIAWENARVQELSPGTPVAIVPITLDGDYKVKNGNGDHTSLLTGNVSLFIFRDHQQTWHSEVVIAVPEETGSRFSGLVIVEDWQGNALRTLQYTNGKKAEQASEKMQCIPTQWIESVTYGGQEHAKSLYTSYNCIVKNDAKVEKNSVAINYGAGVRAKRSFIAQLR